MHPLMAPEDDANDEKHSKDTVVVVIDDKQLDEPLGLKAVWTNLLQKSSIYALSQLAHSKSWARRVLWLLVLVVGLSGLFYEAYRFLSLYIQYPVIITLEVTNPGRIRFPGVTICNLNRMNVIYEECIKDNTTVKKCEHDSSILSSEGWIKTSIAPSERGTFTDYNLEYAGFLNTPEQIKSYEDQRQENIKLLNGYTERNSVDRFTIGHQKEHFIAGCAFNRERCTPSNFTLFQSLQYGNCYTFNGKELSQPLDTRQTGPNSGLDVILDLEIEKYGSLAQAVGARVMIHEPTEDPNPEDYGINISPGYETSVAIQMNEIRRLQAPYRDMCVNYSNKKSTESYVACKRLCLQQQNIISCDCADTTFLMLPGMKHCNLSDANIVACLDEVLESVRSRNCNCPLPCLTVDFIPTISTAEWPKIIKTNCTDIAGCNAASGVTANQSAIQEISISKENRFKSRNTFVKIKVFYKTLEVTSYKQEPMFQESELFSQLGGQMGLWLGLSLVALFECIESLLFVMHFLWTRNSA